jgi:ABC-type Mn2+/Zn2+ transport system ATPase subunit
VASLIPEMSLVQNILIDFSSDSLTESKEMQFQDFLKIQNNRALEKLYQTIVLPNELPHLADAQMRKVCSLIKSLLSEGNFIFLEEPELDLDPSTLSIFISALKEHIKDRQINVFIYSKNLTLWMPHSQNLVERNSDFSFNIKLINTNYLWDIEREKFFTQTMPKKPMDKLKFILPKDKNRKKSAA